MSLDKIAILGAGNLGTANAIDLARKGVSQILIYARNHELVDYINQTRRHPKHFTDVRLPDSIEATCEPERLSEFPYLIIDLHSTGIREVLSQIKRYIADEAVIINDAKGLENGTGKLPLQIAEEELSGIKTTLVARSGWMLAQRIVYGKMCCVAVASADESAALEFARLISGPNFKVQISNDITGTQWAGVMKNPYAISAGFFDGVAERDPEHKDFYSGVKLDYMTMATAEARILAEGLGCDPMTFNRGSRFYAWWTDYYNSSTGDTANRLFGQRIGEGMSPQEAFESVQKEKSRTPEGLHTTRELYSIAQRRGIELPILKNTFEVLFEGKKLEDAVMEVASQLSTKHVVFGELTRQYMMGIAERICMARTGK